MNTVAKKFDILATSSI